MENAEQKKLDNLKRMTMRVDDQDIAMNILIGKSKRTASLSKMKAHIEGQQENKNEATHSESLYSQQKSKRVGPKKRKSNLLLLA